MTIQEATKEIESWSCIDSGQPYIDSIDAIKMVERIYAAKCKELKEIWNRLEQEYSKSQEAWEREASMYNQGYADAMATAQEMLECKYPECFNEE